MTLSPFIRATGERMVRGAIAAEVGAYLAGNIVFNATSIGVTLNNVLAIGVGGAVSALALSLGINATNGGNGPALTNAENVAPTTPVQGD